MNAEDEAEVILNMLKHAIREGLEHEVLTEYLRDRRLGVEPGIAANCALLEWDI